MIYQYYINLDERGEFYSDVRDNDGETVAEFFDTVEFDEDGHGDVRNIEDVTDYLVGNGVIEAGDDLEWGV